MNKAHKKFIEDMENAGLEIRTYQGRWFWKGPAVSVDSLQDALSNTKVPCKWDQLGLGYIVHPAASCDNDSDFRELEKIYNEK